jgi:signal transduction histidine kinase
MDALGQAQEQQRELAALKDQFIIYVNHELRTPVMGLYNSLELLDLNFRRGDDPERRTRLLQRALTAGDALIVLLRNVLDTSVVETQTLRLATTAIPLAPFVRTVLETFNPRELTEPGLESHLLQPRAVTMDIAPDLAIVADEGRVRQVLVNLLSNALKYSAAGTPITINAAVIVAPSRRDAARLPRWGGGPHAADPARAPGHAQAGIAEVHQESITRPVVASTPRMVRVSIRDHGLGVPSRDAHKLFNRFTRLERDIASTVRGTGVGLYLCRVLVEAMGGRIWVESTGVPGEGSTFTFTLPLSPATEGRPTTPLAPMAEEVAMLTETATPPHAAERIQRQWE